MPSVQFRLSTVHNFTQLCFQKKKKTFLLNKFVIYNKNKDCEREQLDVIATLVTNHPHVNSNPKLFGVQLLLCSASCLVFGV